MVKRIYLDTGIITLHYAKNEPPEVQSIFNDIKEKKITAYVMKPVLIEVFNHLCTKIDKSFAESCLSSLLRNYQIIFVEITNDIIFKAGGLKCQYRRKLSYFDCLILAFSLNQKLLFYTTEKDLPKIRNLKVKEISF